MHSTLRRLKYVLILMICRVRAHGITATWSQRMSMEVVAQTQLVVELELWTRELINSRLKRVDVRQLLQFRVEQCEPITPMPLAIH